MKRVLVCGGRDYRDAEFVDFTLSSYVAPDDVVIEGGAMGADREARLWAQVNGNHIDTYPADWKAHGRGAGHIRNQQMLDEGKPDLVIAFPGGRGTANMVECSLKAGVRVIDLRHFSYE